MSFLIYNDETLANKDLSQANNNYGCPLTLPNSYIMQKWADLIKKYDDNYWAFFKPDDEHMNGIDNYIDEWESLPDDWFE